MAVIKKDGEWYKVYVSMGYGIRLVKISEELAKKTLESQSKK